MKYKVSELFFSIQGEGCNIGIPMIFIRLAGCNLKCSFCDTSYALKKGKKMSESNILDFVKKYPCNKVCITGGEPFTQDLMPLIDELQSYWIAIETNGTIWQDLVPVFVDWIAVSPKGKYDKRFLDIANEFKYVITKVEDITKIDRQIVRLPLFLQPVNNNTLIAKEITLQLKSISGKYPNWRLGLQYQKFLWGNVKGK